MLTWISGFCVGTGLAGLVLASVPACVRPDMTGSVGMLIGGVCALALIRPLTQKR